MYEYSVEHAYSVITRILFVLQVHEVEIDENGIVEPEVKIVKLHDVVAWTFDDPRIYDVHLLNDNTSDSKDETANDDKVLKVADTVPQR